jgi:hypothetical protein
MEKHGGAWSMEHVKTLMNLQAGWEKGGTSVRPTGYVRTAVAVLDEDDGISGWLT